MRFLYRDSSAWQIGLPSALALIVALVLNVVLRKIAAGNAIEQG
jgi:hypothetical protein